MNANELRSWILELTVDITFRYKGIDGAICPISDELFYLSYGDDAKDLYDIDSVMNDTMFDGKSLSEISEQCEFD